MDLDLHLGQTHVLITGGSGYIGSTTVTALLSAGCLVTSLDIKPSSNKAHFESSNFQFVEVDITDENTLIQAFTTAEKAFGVVATCIALASLDLSVLQHHDSVVNMSVEQWRRTHQVNVEGTFLTARTWLRGLRKYMRNSEGPLPSNVSLIIIGSESGIFGERGNADYAAGKSAVQGGLLKSLAADAVRICPTARVNAVAPGPVDTEQFRRECTENPNQLWLDSQATTAQCKPVPPEQVAKSILFLASEAWSGSICGQILQVDSGKQGKLLWMRDEVLSTL